MPSRRPPLPNAAPLAAALILAALALAGCGRRGPLEPPPDASVTAPAVQFQRGPVRRTTDPAPTTLATQPGAIVQNTPDDDGVEDAPAFTVNPQPTPSKRSRAYVVPKQPFLLDPLL